jgi:hypothetical protein
MILCIVDFELLEELHYALICTATVQLNILCWPDTAVVVLKYFVYSKNVYVSVPSSHKQY